MLRITTLLASAAVAALILAAPAGAAQTLKTATFKATLTGNQVTTWSYDDTDDPNDPCDGASRGDGSQSIAFASKPMRLQAFHGKQMFKKPTFVPFMQGKATIEREGDYTVLNTPYDPDACGPAVDGGGGPVDDLIDCGQRTAEISLHPGWDQEVEADDEGLVPLVSKDSLILSGELGAWLGYLNCPYWIGGGAGPSEDALLQSWEIYAPKKVFDKKRKRIVISGDRTQTFRAPNFEGKTLITWNLRLTRIR